KFRRICQRGTEITEKEKGSRGFRGRVGLVPNRNCGPRWGWRRGAGVWVRVLFAMRYRIVSTCLFRGKLGVTPRSGLKTTPEVRRAFRGGRSQATSPFYLANFFWKDSGEFVVGAGGSLRYWPDLLRN